MRPAEAVKVKYTDTKQASPTSLAWRRAGLGLLTEYDPSWEIPDRPGAHGGDTGPWLWSCRDDGLQPSPSVGVH